MESKKGEIIIYQTEDARIDVRLENDTVWLTQAQMAELFQTDRTSIVRHINNIYKTDELTREATCAKIAQVQTEGSRQVTRVLPYFNLDMIISVGYRVNSKRGIKFRQWANRILKEYLVNGYAVNERMRKEQISELRQLVGMLGRTIQNQTVLSTDETNALFNVVTDYTAPPHSLSWQLRAHSFLPFPGLSVRSVDILHWWNYLTFRLPLITNSRLAVNEILFIREWTIVVDCPTVKDKIYFSRTWT